MTDGPQDRVPGLGAAALRFLGALLWGRYPEDAKARKRAAAGGLGLTLLSLMAWMLMRSDARTDHIIEAQRDDLRDATAVMLRSVVAVEALTRELQAQRTTLLEKIPDATPPPKPVRVQPVGRSKR